VPEIEIYLDAILIREAAGDGQCFARKYSQ
jgi:hypothetical protein